jgi:hypothetical protein
MKIWLIFCLFLGLCCSAKSQVTSGSQQKVGGGGYFVRIPTDAQMERIKQQKETPAGMTSKMVWATPGKVVARHKQDDEIILEITYIKKTDNGEEGTTFLVADHPDASDIAVGESAKCIVVPGPIRDDFQGRRLYYFFDKKEVTERNLGQFKAQCHDADLQ